MRIVFPPLTLRRWCTVRTVSTITTTPNGLCYLHTEPKAKASGYSGDAVCVEPDDFCSYGEPKEGAE